MEDLSVCLSRLVVGSRCFGVFSMYSLQSISLPINREHRTPFYFRIYLFLISLLPTTPYPYPSDESHDASIHNDRRQHILTVHIVGTIQYAVKQAIV